MSKSNEAYEAKCEKARAAYPDLCAVQGEDYVIQFMDKISSDERDYWMRTVSRLRMRNSDMLDLLENAAEVLADYADVRDSEDGPKNNSALSMLDNIREFLQRVRK